MKMLRFLNLFSIILIGLSGEILSAPQQQQQHQFKQITELPPNFPHCAENDGQINECLRNGLQFVVGKLKTGLPEINLPKLDPYVIEKANFNFANTAVNGKVSLINMEVNGLSGISLKNVAYQHKGNKVQFAIEGTLPKLFVKGQHKANVELNNAKISSKGTFDVTLSDVNVNVKLNGELQEQDGHQILHVSKITLDPTVSNMKLQATGLFEEPALNDAIVDSINQNWRQFYKSLVTESHQSWEPIIIKVINNFCKYLPFDLLVTSN